MSLEAPVQQEQRIQRPRKHAHLKNLRCIDLWKGKNDMERYAATAGKRGRPHNDTRGKPWASIASSCSESIHNIWRYRFNVNTKYANNRKNVPSALPIKENLSVSPIRESPGRRKASGASISRAVSSVSTPLLRRPFPAVSRLPGIRRISSDVAGTVGGFGPSDPATYLS